MADQDPKSTPSPKTSRNIVGAWAGRGLTCPTKEEWAAMDKEIEDDFLNGPLFPPEMPENP